MAFDHETQETTRKAIVSKIFPHHAPDSIDHMPLAELILNIESAAKENSGLVRRPVKLSRFIGDYLSTLGGADRSDLSSRAEGEQRFGGASNFLQISPDKLEAFINHYSSLVSGEKLQEYVDRPAPIPTFDKIARRDRRILSSVYCGILAVSDPNPSDDRSIAMDTSVKEIKKEIFNAILENGHSGITESSRLKIKGWIKEFTEHPQIAAGKRIRTPVMNNVTELSKLLDNPYKIDRYETSESASYAINLGIVIGMKMQAEKNKCPLSQVIDEAIASGRINVEPRGVKVTPKSDAPPSVAE